MNGNISYDSNNLQTFNPAAGTGIITNLIDHAGIPEKDVALFAKADANGSAIPSINYPSKTITIGGAIKGAKQIIDEVVVASAQADLDNRIDTFKGYFNGKDKNLDIAYGTGVRRYIATANAISINRQQRADFATFTVEFVCTNPFGIDTSPTVIANQQNYTSATLNMTPTITGSAPYQVPVFTITIDALTGDGDYVQITNDNNGQGIIVFGLGLQAGDVVVIDCANRVVTINGAIVDYVGSFLELRPGANSITYTDGFTTRTVDIVANYSRRWL